MPAASASVVILLMILFPIFMVKYVAFHIFAGGGELCRPLLSVIICFAQSVRLCICRQGLFYSSAMPLGIYLGKLLASLDIRAVYLLC